MLISLHLPKTAGTSFAKSLESFYGDKILKDYADAPLNTPVQKRHVMAILNKLKPRNIKGVNCIHGHFMPYKYSNLTGKAQFVTWMRDPIERLASHYYYWVKYSDTHYGRGLHKKVVEENWSFEQFAFSKEMRNTYTQFLWRFPITNFSFVGITEYFEEEMKYFSSMFLKGEVPDFRENVNDLNKGKYIEDTELRQRLEKYHSTDMELYKFALDLKKKR